MAATAIALVELAAAGGYAAGGVVLLREEPGRRGDFHQPLPQAFSHLALVEAGARLSVAEGIAEAVR